mmetsp:Transcript_54691/g.127930  ORF Transcript_54691/g.127930 Transcript_54691/m.127930 type:complete len:226 (+) Transcript_54691:144-821(+)
MMLVSVLPHQGRLASSQWGAARQMVGCWQQPRLLLKTASARPAVNRPVRSVARSGRLPRRPVVRLAHDGTGSLVLWVRGNLGSLHQRWRPYLGKPVLRRRGARRNQPKEASHERKRQRQKDRLRQRLEELPQGPEPLRPTRRKSPRAVTTRSGMRARIGASGAMRAPLARAHGKAEVGVRSGMQRIGAMVARMSGARTGAALGIALGLMGPPSGTSTSLSRRMAQ